ncbi:MAG: hypothetical protein DMF68_13880 [Acidobacteria bacterium]|nr:MAG: hypothetical protein DMF68_13880 [Acidobacteriota bacterium]
MNNLKSYLLAAVGIVSLIAAFTLNIVRANNADTATVSSTSHFKLGRTYLLMPANGTGNIKCKVTEVDGAWLGCEGLNELVNTNTMMTELDLK